MDGRQKGVTVRGNILQANFSYRGIRCRESLGLPVSKPNMKHANSLKTTIEHEIAMGTFSYAKHFPNSKNSKLGQTGSNKSVKAALDDFLEASKRRCSPSTLKDYRSIVEFHLKPNFGHFMMCDLTSSEVKVWMANLNISNKRINNILTPLRAVLGDAFADGLIERNPINRVKNLPNRHSKPDPFSLSERKKILSVMEVQIRNLFEFAFWTGMRTSELIAVEWGGVTLIGRSLEFGVLMY